MKLSVLTKITKIFKTLFKKYNRHLFFLKNQLIFFHNIKENIKENIIKNVKNLFRFKKKIKKETNDTAIKDIRNLFRLKNENIINFFHNI